LKEGFEMKKLSLLGMFAVGMLVAMSASAQEAEAAAAGLSMAKAVALMAAGLAIGIAALGGALGQGRTAGAAMDGIARNPGARGEMFVPMILGLALIESLVIYALVIAFIIIGKV
jgi:F-type H+-transporting ATPase subunit c